MMHHVAFAMSMVACCVIPAPLRRLKDRHILSLAVSHRTQLKKNITVDRWAIAVACL
jgi:hypothetical protein